MFCAIAIMLEKLTVEKEVSVINTVCQVRGRRRTAVQQYVRIFIDKYLLKPIKD